MASTGLNWMKTFALRAYLPMPVFANVLTVTMPYIIKSKELPL